MKGHIQRRGKQSWRLKFDIGDDPLTGQRRTQYKAVKGKRADAERELRAVLFRHDKGFAIDPSKKTVAKFLDDWLDDVAPQRVAPKSLERYRRLGQKPDQTSSRGHSFAETPARRCFRMDANPNQRGETVKPKY